MTLTPDRIKELRRAMRDSPETPVGSSACGCKSCRLRYAMKELGEELLDCADENARLRDALASIATHTTDKAAERTAAAALASATPQVKT